MYGIGRAEAARFERHSRCFERHSKVLRATQQKGARAVSVTMVKFPHFHPYGSGAPPDLSFTRYRGLVWSFCVARVPSRISNLSIGMLEPLRKIR